MSQSRPRLVITGASGFIGTACLKALSTHGQVVTAVTSQASPPFTLPNVEWISANLLHPGAAAELMHRLKPTHLLHVAWYAKPGAYWSSPENLTWLAASTEMFQAFGAAGGARAIGVGTCAEYAGFAAEPSANRSPSPATIYGRSKLAAGLALEAAASAYGFSSGWARIFYPYGPGEPKQRLIASLIDSLLRGDRVACTEGTQMRDLIYVDDVGDALAALLHSDIIGMFDVGTGQGTTIRSLIELICARLGYDCDRVHFGARPLAGHEPDRMVADPHRLPVATGWRPSTDLDVGIARTIAARRIDANIAGE